MMNLHGRAACDVTSSSGCEQMVTESKHVDGEMLGLVVTDVPNIVGVRVGSPVRTSDHSVIFIDVVPFL